MVAERRAIRHWAIGFPSSLGISSFVIIITICATARRSPSSPPWPAARAWCRSIGTRRRYAYARLGVLQGAGGRAGVSFRKRGRRRTARAVFVPGAGPFLQLQAHNRTVWIDNRGTVTTQEHPDPLRLLEEILAKYRAPHVPGLPRFSGGAVGYAGYDTVRYAERLPHPPADDRGLPDLCFALYDRMVIFDHVNKTVLAVANAEVGSQKSEVSEDELRRTYNATLERVDRLVERLQRGAAGIQLTDIDADRRSPVGLDYRSNFAPRHSKPRSSKPKNTSMLGTCFRS